MENKVIDNIINSQVNFTKSNSNSVNYRIQILNSLLKSINKNEGKIYSALKKDLNKHEFESFLSEILLVKREIKLFTKKLKRWSKKKKVRGSIFNFPSKNYLVPEPYGNVLIITPWNYPFQLSLTPLIGAIAAGNSVIIKPSELAPNTSTVLKDLIESVFPRNLACVIEGDATIAKYLLEKKWDYIFFTGSTRIGKIIAEKAGSAKLVDLVNGIAVREETDDATGMTQKIVVDWRAAPKGNDLKPEIILVDKDGEPVRNDADNPITYPMSVDAILSIEDGSEIKAGDVIARIPREGAKTKDITGGLPRVAELFEARRPKDHAIIAEIDGYVRFGRDYKNKRRITIEPADETLEPVEYMVPKGKHIPVVEGDFVQKGDYIMDGNPAPHDILAIMGIEALANYMHGLYE